MLVQFDGFDAYPSGCAFSVDIQLTTPFRSKEPFSIEAEPRFGIAFSDGRRGSSSFIKYRPSADPDHPVLIRNGASYDSFHYVGTLWLWPLPPPGRLILHMVWPKAGLPETSVQIADGSTLQQAAEEAEQLWEIEGAGDV